MTDEQRAALTDALAPLQHPNYDDLAMLDEQLTDALRVVQMVRGVFVTRGPENLIVGYTPSSPEQIEEYARAMQRMVAAFTEMASMSFGEEETQ